jgi:hypothetical protein
MPVKSIMLFSNGNTGVFDESDQQIGELQKGWLEIWCEWMESKGVDVSQVDDITTILNGRKVKLHPFKSENGWCEDEKPDDFRELDGMTWCQDRINENDVAYVRETLPKVTRVEVVDQNGRSYTNWSKDNQVELSLQDNGKTIKVFITRK